MTEYIRVHHKIAGSDALGMGVRYLLWLQGCDKNCPGCMSRKAADLNGGSLVKISDLAEEICLSGLKEITISGGEPFLQPEALSELLKRLKEKDFGVIVYTGRLYEELKDGQETAKALSYIDVLIDGEYEAEKDDGRAYVGSSNQRILRLSGRYSAETLQSEYGSAERKVQVEIKDGELFLAGVPDKEMLEKIKKLF